LHLKITLSQLNRIGFGEFLVTEYSPFNHEWTAAKVQPALSILVRRKTMAWSKPTITEISVGLEINSYACAEK